MLPAPWRSLIVGSVLSALPLAGAVAQEESPNTVEQGESVDGIDPTLGIRDELEEDNTLGTLLPSWYTENQQRWRNTFKKLRIEYAMAYDVMAQGFLTSGQSFGGMAGDLSLSGRWRISKGFIDGNPPYVAFRIRHRHSYGGWDAPSQIRERAGLLWGTVEGFTDSGFEIPDLYLTRRFGSEGNIQVRFGQLAIDSFLDNHRLRSGKRKFFSQAFSANPAVAFPTYGAGGVFTWVSPEERWDLSFGFSNVQGTRETESVNWDIGSDALFEAVQAGFNFTGFGGRKARIQAMLWHSDAIKDEDIPEGEGISLTFEHEWTEDRDIFLRLAESNREATRVDRFIALGAGQAVNRFDHWGAAIGAGQDSRGDRGWQGVLEVFYRWQATQEFHVSPDFQFIVGDDIADGRSWATVFGLRCSLTF